MSGEVRQVSQVIPHEISKVSVLRIHESLQESNEFIKVLKKKYTFTTQSYNLHIHVCATASTPRKIRYGDLRHRNIKINPKVHSPK